MKPLTMVGAILLALGVIGLIWGGYEYFDNRSEVEIGDVNIVVSDEVPPILIIGGIAAAAGVVVIAVGALGRGRN